MRRISQILLAIIMIFVISPTAVYAESETIPDEEPTVVEKIIESSNGNVEIEIPESILEKILTPPTSGKKQSGKENQRATIHKQQGYRIQVFCDGRNQGSLQARARARGNAIASRFPKYRGQIYTFSVSPNVYTRVGNFTSQTAANAALAELKRAFPAFAGEMRVVKCKISSIR